jgi:hypothetical protein
MLDSDAILSKAEQTVLEADKLVTRQLALVERLEREGLVDLAERAKTILATLEHSHKLAEQQLVTERYLYGVG